MRSTTRSSEGLVRPLLIVAALLTSGCAFTEGDPWGVAEVGLELRFETPEGRLDERGRLKTSNDYRVELTRLEVRPGLVTLQISEGGGPLAFDPANPPPGYSLCHNGHCHADDGSLPTYAEIEAELLGTSSAATEVPVTLPEGTVNLLVGGPVSLDMRRCPERCALPRGTLSTARVELLELTLEAVVYDGTSQGRLPESGMPIAGTLSGPVPLTLSVGEALQPGEEVGVRLAIDLDLDPSLFDSIDWPQISTIADARDAFLENIREGAELTLNVSRFNP